MGCDGWVRGWEAVGGTVVKGWGWGIGWWVEFGGWVPKGGHTTSGIPDIFLLCHSTRSHLKKIPDTTSRVDFLPSSSLITKLFCSPPVCCIRKNTSSLT